MVCLTCQYLVDVIVTARTQGTDICNCDALQTVCQLCREAPKSEGPKKAATKRKRKTKIRFAELKASLNVSSWRTPLTSVSALPRSGSVALVPSSGLCYPRACTLVSPGVLAHFP